MSTRRTGSRLLIAITIAMAAVGASVPAAKADLPAGSFTFDGSVDEIAHTSDATYVAGGFSSERALTGGGLMLTPTTGVAPEGGFPHIAGDVSAVVDDGAGGWFVGGEFGGADGVRAPNLVHVLPGGTISVPFAPDPDGRVTALARSGSALYVAGRFDNIGGEARHRLAAVDTTSGAALDFDPDPGGGSSGSGDVYALAATGSVVYAGGDFSRIGGQARACLAALDPSTGQATAFAPPVEIFGVEGEPIVRSLALSAGSLYVGGTFDHVAGTGRVNVAAVDASTGALSGWNPGADGSVNAIVAGTSTVYLGGTFDTAGGLARSSLAAIDASSGAATTFAPNPDRAVNALALSGSTLYVGGTFTALSGVMRHGAAALDVTSANASAFDPSPTDDFGIDAPRTVRVRAVGATGPSVYVGGDFAAAGPPLATVGHLAKLDAAGNLVTAWKPEPQLARPDVGIEALAVSGSTLYVGGAFASIGGASRSNLAAVDTGTGAVTPWRPDPDDEVDALAVAGGNVLAGGTFSVAGGQSRHGLVQLDATTAAATPWNPSPDGNVNRMVVAGQTLYVAGDFAAIGATPRARLAAVDLTSGNPTPFAPNPNGFVHGVAVLGGTVYAGGDFSSIGGMARDHLAGLDAGTGIATAFAPETDDAVDGVGAAGSTLYAQITRGVSAVEIVGFDLASGAPTAFSRTANGFVYTLLVSGTELRLGGAFTTVDATATGPYAALTDPAGSADVVPPTISVTTPADGQHFAAGSSVASVFSCEDGAGSGVAACNGPAAIDTSSPGSKSFVVTAADNAGNGSSKTVGYVVDPFAGTPTATPTSTMTPTVAPTTTVTTPTPTSAPSSGCRAPALTGRSLAAAKKAIRKAGCAVGSVKRPKKVKKGRKLVVKSQQRAGSKVNLVLKAVRK